MNFSRKQFSIAYHTKFYVYNFTYARTFTMNDVKIIAPSFSNDKQNTDLIFHLNAREENENNKTTKM